MTDLCSLQISRTLTDSSFFAFFFTLVLGASSRSFLLNFIKDWKESQMVSDCPPVLVLDLVIEFSSIPHDRQNFAPELLISAPQF